MTHAADTFCDQLLQCDQGQNATDRAMVSSAADCRARLETALRSDLSVQSFIDDGSVRVSDANLRACLDAIAAAPCVPSDRVPACRETFVGTLAAGLGCVADVQCVSGACSAAFGQCGSCLAPAAIGEACELLNDNCANSPSGAVRCEPNGVGGAGICVLQTTTYLSVTLGEGCSNQNNVRRYCLSPFYCDATDVCAARKVAGAACDPDFDECAFGTTCSTAGATPTCVAVVVATTAGEPCGDLASGAFARCDRSKRLYCDTTGNGGDVCALLAGDGSENSDCLVASDCKAHLVCILGDALDRPGTCETSGKAIATTCGSDLECASHYCAPPTVGGGQRACAAPPVCP